MKTTAMKKITTKQIIEAEYKGLITIAKSLGLKFEKQKKDSLQSTCLAQLEKPSVKLLSDEVKEIINNKDLGKSEKVRRLVDLNIQPKTISDLTGAHYSHVISAKRAYVKTEKKSTKGIAA